MNNLKIGAFIQALRKSKGLTQAEVAEYFQISPKTVSKWECGDALPEIPMLKALAEYYDVTVDELLNGEKGKVVEQPKTQTEYSNYIYHKRNKQLTIFFILSLGILFIAVCLFHIVYTTSDNDAVVSLFTYLLVAIIGIVFFSISLYIIGGSQNSFELVNYKKFRRKKYIFTYLVLAFFLLFFIHVYLCTDSTSFITYNLILLCVLIGFIGLFLLLYYIIPHKKY